jgi:hypothetical protein
MEEERALRLVSSQKESTLTPEQLDNLLYKDSDQKVDYDLLANKVAIKLNTQVGEELKRNSEKIDKLTNGITELINEFRKQSVDENNSSFKVARANEKANFTINSLDYHIAHVISFTHIAECYHLVTDKDEAKISVNKARKLLIDLNLLTDENYVSKVLNGSKTITKKYHFDILSEIKNRLMNPTRYNIPIEVSEKWRRIALIPEESEIKAKIDEVFALFDQ